jgi:serine/threonine-protein kinase
MAGMIVGTAAYMSPEQAKGRTVDRRTDIFAFGCVLYEMLTGKRTFDGDDVTDILGAVLRIEPDWSALPENMPAGLRNLLRLCLEKSVKNRRSDAADLRLDIEQVIQESVNPAPKPIELVQQPFWKLVIPAVIAGILIAAISGSLVWLMRPLPSDAVIRFSYLLPKDQSFTRPGRPILALSPDGANMVFVANEQLYLKPMSEMEAKPIPGTKQDITTPFFSPDGKSIGFWVTAEKTLKRIAITGGASITIAPEIDNPYGATWYSDDSIMVGQGAKGIVRVPANGGKPETVIEAKPDEVLYGPQVLPGGNELLFTVAGTTGDDRFDKAQIVVQSLKTGVRKPLGITGSDARYVSTGHIVYALGGNLFAVAFDAKKLKVTRGPISIVQGVRSAVAPEFTTAATFFSFSSNGHLVYIPQNLSSQSNTVLTLVDRAGAKKAVPLMPGKYSVPRISPNGKQVAMEVEDGKDVNIAVYDLDGTSEMRPLTFGGKNLSPLWSYDGQHIIFQSDRDKDGGLFSLRADGSGSPEKLTTPETGKSYFPESALRGGNLIALGGTGQISILSLEDHKIKMTIPKLPPGSFMGSATFSPNGRWIAYQTTSKGIGRIYVQPFPPTGQQYQITIGDVSNELPLWSQDGTQLFYVEGLGAYRLGEGGAPPVPRIMAVDVQMEPTFKKLKTTQLPVNGFSAIRRVLAPVPTARNFDISREFIVLLPEQSGDSASLQINAVLNWFEELKQRVPVH